MNVTMVSLAGTNNSARTVNIPIRTISARSGGTRSAIRPPRYCPSTPTMRTATYRYRATSNSSAYGAFRVDELDIDQPAEYVAEEIRQEREKRAVVESAERDEDEHDQEAAGEQHARVSSAIVDSEAAPFAPLPPSPSMSPSETAFSVSGSASSISTVRP